MSTVTKYRVLTTTGFVEFASQELAQVYAEEYGFATPTLVIETRPSSAQETIEQAIRLARQFGSNLITKFAAENVLLGITQAGKTKSVRQTTSEVVQCLQTGSLYDAMAEIRLIPEEDKDSTFITDARLLAFVNEIEAYLGLPKSSSL